VFLGTGRRPTSLPRADDEHQDWLAPARTSGAFYGSLPVFGLTFVASIAAAGELR
jgi:hypothetical protein